METKDTSVGLPASNSSLTDSLTHFPHKVTTQGQSAALARTSVFLVIEIVGVVYKSQEPTSSLFFLSGVGDLNIHAPVLNCCLCHTFINDLIYIDIWLHVNVNTTTDSGEKH